MSKSTQDKRAKEWKKVERRLVRGVVEERMHSNETITGYANGIKETRRRRRRSSEWWSKEIKKLIKKMKKSYGLSPTEACQMIR